MNIKMNNNKITINGMSFCGSSVSISKGKITVDGKECEVEKRGKIVINVEGDVEKIEIEDGEVTAESVGNITTQSADVNCGRVGGSIRTMSGSVVCTEVQGSVSSMSGSIVHR
ncbi:MAG TPA: hypothetical protein DCS09_08585 [Porphyromonadaceae bacterium]|nr:hypothetical protein [Porphyromonadaceae bacterium]